MPPAPERAQRSRTCLYIFLACITAALMLRSFFFLDQLNLVRPHTLTYIESVNGFITVAHVSTAEELHPLGLSRTANPISTPSLAHFEDESLFFNHFKHSSIGFDAELFGFQAFASFTDERQTVSLQIPHWSPIAAFSLLASAGLLRRAARFLLPKTSGFTPIYNAARTPPTP